ncbi:MAG: hypothetical protein ABIO44_14435 [Saprospiraceae bacterium]
MNVLKSFLGIILVVGSLVYFNSCAKDSSQELTSNLSLNSSSNIDYLMVDPTTSADKNPCYTYVFPLDVQVGRDKVTVNSQEELDKLLRKTTTSTVRAQILYPYSVIVVATGVEVLISSERDLEVIRKNCSDTKGDPKRMACYTLAFPLNVTLADGTTQTVNSLEELNTLRKSSTKRDAFRIQFPFDVILANGTKVTITTKEELNALEARCKHSGKRKGQ